MSLLIISNLDIETLADSNLFLRALWSTLRKHYGNIGWLFSPRKDGNKRRISFGYLTLGSDGKVQVKPSIEYKVAGIIDAISFEPAPFAPSELGVHEEIIKSCVHEALEIRKSLNSDYVSAVFETNPNVPFYYYRGDHWYCGPLDCGATELGVKINGFDEPDMKYQAHIHMELLVDVLSALTNVAITRVYRESGERVISDDEVNIFGEDSDWLDDYPVENNYLRIQKTHLMFCDQMLAGTAEASSIIQATNLFHKSLRIYNDLRGYNDIALSLFMSTLEAVSVTDQQPGTCKTCGQQQHRISHRIKELGLKHLGEGVEQIFKNSYSRRSQYLHAGKRISRMPFLSHTLPQLDPSGVQGCETHEASNGPYNLKEFTSYVLRKEIERTVTSLKG